MTTRNIAAALERVQQHLDTLGNFEAFLCDVGNGHVAVDRESVVDAIMSSMQAWVSYRSTTSDLGGQVHYILCNDPMDIIADVSVSLDDPVEGGFEAAVQAAQDALETMQWPGRLNTERDA